MRKRIGLARVCTLILALALTLCAQGFAEGAYNELKLGDTGDDVRALQERLALLGYYPRTCDGMFNTDMEEAVIAFNKVHGLDGNVATADMQTVAYSNGAVPFTESDEGLLITLESIAEGTYTGTLPGDSYTTGEDDGSYDISPDISPAEITLTIQDGQAQLYCAASASADGKVFGVKTPRSPSYTQTVAGTLPLRQLGITMVRAEGDLTAPGEGLWVNWDKNKKFTKWDVEPRDYTYHCTVSITMTNGVPTAEVVAAGSASSRSCTIPLSLRADGVQKPAPDQLLYLCACAGK